MSRYDRTQVCTGTDSRIVVNFCIEDIERMNNTRRVGGKTNLATELVNLAGNISAFVHKHHKNDEKVVNCTEAFNAQADLINKFMGYTERLQVGMSERTYGVSPLKRFKGFSKNGESTVLDLNCNGERGSYTSQDVYDPNFNKLLSTVIPLLPEEVKEDAQAILQAAQKISTTDYGEEFLKEAKVVKYFNEGEGERFLGSFIPGDPRIHDKVDAIQRFLIRQQDRFGEENSSSRQIMSMKSLGAGMLEYTDLRHEQVRSAIVGSQGMFTITCKGDQAVSFVQGLCQKPEVPVLPQEVRRSVPQR